MITTSEISEILKKINQLSEQECDQYIAEIEKRIDEEKKLVALLEDVIYSINWAKDLKKEMRENEYRSFHLEHRVVEEKMGLIKNDERLEKLREKEWHKI